jgi:hypothetical protein
MINEVLVKTIKDTGADDVWLADTIESLIVADEDRDGTKAPINELWQSPFSGKSVEEAFKYLATVSLELSLNRTYIMVLNKALYEQKDWLVIYRIDEDGEITSIPCDTQMCMVHIDSYSWHHWPEYLEEWREEGKPVFAFRHRNPRRR